MLDTFRLICPDCGKTPKKDETKSNKNWTVIPARCPDCNKQLILKTI